MPTRHANVPHCPKCGSYGIYKRRRRWWQRLLLLPAQYRCHECGEVSSAAAVRRQSVNTRPPDAGSSFGQNGA